MNPNKDGGPAFPAVDSDIDGDTMYLGMSLRDYFAAKALQGLCANQDWLNNVSKTNLGMSTPEIVAATAYEIAEAMLKLGEKRHGR